MLAWTSLVSCVLALQATGAGPPVARFEVQAPTVRWQELPENICRMGLEPDGRRWIQGQPYGVRSIDELKRLVETEFLHEAPQIRGATLELVEPSGRIWLSNREWNESIILGYDGRIWCEWRKKIDPRSDATDYKPAVFAGGVAWFPTTEGVLRFADGKFHLQQMRATRKDELPAKPAVSFLAVSPGGESAMAANAEGRWLWQFHEGQWSHHTLPEDFPQHRCPSAWSDRHTFWYVNADRHLRCRQMPGAPINKNAEQQFELLDSGDFQVREKASKSLRARGPAVCDYLERQLQVATDAELRLRLQDILKYAQDPSNGACLHELTVFGVGCLQLLPDQRLLIWANEVYRNNEKLGCGFVIWQQESPALFIACPNFRGISQCVFAVPNSEHIWITSHGYASGSVLLDLKHGKALETIPWSITGVEREDQAFLRGLVFSPRLPDERKALPAAPEVFNGRHVAVAADGLVWMRMWSGKGVVCFDGKTSRQVELPGESSGVDQLEPLANGYVLAREINSPKVNWYLINRERVARYGSIREMIEQDLDRCRQAFRGPVRATSGAYAPFCVTVDAADNLWCAHGKLELYDGAKWHDATDALKRAGSRTGNVTHVTSIGLGRRVFVTDYDSLRGGTSAFGRWQDGQFHFESAPHADDDQRSHFPVCQADGTLWLFAHEGTNQGNGGLAIHKHLTYRVTDAELSRVDANDAVPFFCDQADNVWIRGRGFNPNFRIWRNGQGLHEFAIRSSRQFVSNAPGSVYTWNGRALVHLVAEESDYRKYRVASQFLIPSLEGELYIETNYSKVAGIVISTPQKTFVVKVPE